MTEKLKNVKKGANPTRVYPKLVIPFVFAFSGRYQYCVGERELLEINPGRGKRRQCVLEGNPWASLDRGGVEGLSPLFHNEFEGEMRDDGRWVRIDVECTRPPYPKIQILRLDRSY